VDVLGDRVARGKRLDRQIAYFPETVTEIAERLRLGVLTAMRSLRDEGILEPASDGRQPDEARPRERQADQDVRAQRPARRNDRRSAGCRYGCRRRA
jgi:hypothetical protein